MENGDAALVVRFVLRFSWWQYAGNLCGCYLAT